jgi:general stress protein 26
MTSASKIEARFWKHLAANPVMMIGLDGEHDGYAQPMTAQFRDATGPIWFFASRKSELVTALTGAKRAMAHYVAKGHELFATVHGALQIETNDARRDQFWVDSMSAWYEGGKSDPDLVLLRLDPESAKIWLSGSGIGMAIKTLFGGVKAAAEGQVARVSLATKK